MTQEPDLAQLSYQAHERGYDDFGPGSSKADQAQAWLDEGSVNSWRFERMYRLALPLLETFPGAQWLTVGDGRYGLDALYLQRHGARALATDISDTLLAEAKRRGIIADYRKENAEALSFADASFDFVLCKESYHHFPRPLLALYEMLRVARRGVLLIEPNDAEIPDSAMTRCSRGLKNIIKGLLGKASHGHAFEELGNYVYTVSPRELEKVALGIGLPAVAFAGVNDYYLPGVEFEPAQEASVLFRRVRARIARYDRLCRLGLNQWGLLGALLLKDNPSEPLRSALERQGYDLAALPANPYSKDRPG
jgi:ubiquinone/menaquinone biosynthesis C-methylase UbiE